MTLDNELDGDTFDYGLAPGESFEPDFDEEIDRSSPHIMTVLGPVEPGALGVVNLDASFAAGAPGSHPDDEAANAPMLREIEEAGFVGIGALVDLNPLVTADDIARSLWLAGRSDLHLIVATGPRAGVDREADTERIVTEAREGFPGTHVCPGLIVTTFAAELLKTANRAHELTRLPLVIRTPPMAAARDMLNAFEICSVNPHGVIISGARDAAEMLIEAGAILLIDTIRGEQQEDRAVAESIASLARAGYSASIVLGYEAPPGKQSVFYGQGSRWSYLIEQFPLLLLDAGLDARTVRSLLVENPNRVLTIQPPR